MFCFGVIVLIVCLPATPKSSNSLLFISKNKEALLQKTKGSRIIFLGGSNLSFGLNSKLIKDSLGLNPINMGVHASLGLQFMMSQYLKNAKRGDIVILIPEYQQYLGDFSNGNEGEELARLIFDVDFKNLFSISTNQRFQIFTHLPKILKSRFDLGEYFGYQFDFIYSKYVYNEFGDIDSKYLTIKKSFVPHESLNNISLNFNLLRDIIHFRNILKMKGINLHISFPGYQETSFNRSRKKISEIYSILINNRFKLVGKPSVFIMPEKYILNSPYHLNRKGANQRTILLINSLNEIL